LTHNRLRVPLALAVALIFPVALAACGRKGGLDLPPSAAVTQPALAAPSAPAAAPTTFIDPTTPTGAAQQAPAQTGQAKLVAPPVEKKTFFLDPLLQ
jgi:predicted small lipoprotein YifL